MDTQTNSAGGLEQEEHVEKKPSYMNRVKAKARKIRDNIGSKMQNHDKETDEEDQFLDSPEKLPEVHGEPKHESPAFKTGTDNLNSGAAPSNLAEHGDAETTREFGERGAPEPKAYSSVSSPTGLNFGGNTNTDQVNTGSDNFNSGTIAEHGAETTRESPAFQTGSDSLNSRSTPSNSAKHGDAETTREFGEMGAPPRKTNSREHAGSCPSGLSFGEKTNTNQINTDLDVSSTPLEVKKPSVEVPLEADKKAVIAELNSTVPEIDSEKPYKWNLESNSEVNPQLEAEKAAVITELNSTIPRMDSEKPYTTSLETNYSPVSTPLEADKEGWMDFGMDQPKVTDLTDAGAKEADVEPMTRSFGDIDIGREPDKSENFYETKSDNMNVDEEPNVNPIYTEKKPSAPSAIAATAASTIFGTAISAKDTVASKLGYKGNDNSNTVTTDAKATDKESASISEETKSSTPSAGDYEKFGGSGTGEVNPIDTEKKPSAPSAIATTAASTIVGTAISAKDIVASKLGYNGQDNSNTVARDAKATDKEGANIGEETKSSTPTAGDYEKFGGSGTGDVSEMKPNVNPIDTEKKPSAPSAIATTAASTIFGTAISAKDIVASKLGYNGQDNSNTVARDAKATDKEGANIGEETKSSTPTADDYEKFGGSFGGSGTGDVSKMTGTEKGTEGVDFVAGHNTGSSMKDYLLEKISPGDEGKPLLEVFSEVMHKPKEEFPEKVAANMDNVTDSAEVTERLGTDERGYERDEYESFGTDGGSLTGGSFGALGMETPNVSKMGEQAVKEHDAGVAKKEAEKMDKVTEAPEVAPRLGTDERGYERDDDDSFGTAPVSTPVSTGGGPDSPTTANMGYVDRAKGLVNKYWYGNEAAPELDDDVRKFADAKAEERKKDESHEKSNAGVADQK